MKKIANIQDIFWFHAIKFISSPNLNIINPCNIVFSP